MHTDFYPIKLTPIYKEMVWGGNRLNTVYNRDIPSDKTGESWEISCRPNEMGIIENGTLAGLPLGEYIKGNPAAVLGTRLKDVKDFPLLIKLIDANDALSIQVHPDDIYAKQTGSPDLGKSEMWCILQPPHDGDLIIGLKPGVTKETFATAYKNGTILNCLNKLKVKSGDIVNIPAGLVHALTPGVMVAEVQQNSDITYRLYDYDRLGLDGKPRPLHVEDGLNVSDYSGKLPIAAIEGLTIKKGNNQLTYSICNRYFAIIKYALSEPITESSNPETFAIFTCVEGDATITANGVTALLPQGSSVFIPAATGEYTIDTKNAVLLKSFVPDTNTDFINPLTKHGYTLEEIHSKVSFL